MPEKDISKMTWSEIWEEQKKSLIRAKIKQYVSIGLMVVLIGLVLFKK